MAAERDVIALLQTMPAPQTFLDGLQLFGIAFGFGLAVMGGYRAFTNMTGL